MLKVNYKDTLTTPVAPGSRVSLVNFEHVIAGWDVKFVSYRLVPLIKFYLIKQTFFYLQEFHIWHRHLTIQVKHTCNKLLIWCVLYFTENKGLTFSQIVKSNFGCHILTSICNKVRGHRS